MPLKLTVYDSDFEVALDNVKYIEEGNVRYFRVANSENVGVNFQYIPILTSHWEKERYEIYLFENSYLDAENDVFEVHESSITDERLGWIFPITILESNENDFRDYKNLNHYKYVAYQKLLELNVNISLRDNSSEFLKLSDVFGNIIICILCKETMLKISNFKFENYLLSFYKYGYLLYGGTPKSKAIYNRTTFVKDMRPNTKVNLNKANFDITANEFTKSLFVEHLLQSDNFLVRFIFLYQIVEYLIDEFSEKLFNEHIENYQTKKLAKNDFRESINHSSTERTLIGEIFSLIPIQKELKDEFISEVDFLYNDIGRITKKKSFPDKIYDIRNLVTHSLRELTTKSESLKRITEIFERIIVDLLTNYKTINATEIEAE